MTVVLQNGLVNARKEVFAVSEEFRSLHLAHLEHLLLVLSADWNLNLIVPCALLVLIVSLDIKMPLLLHVMPATSVLRVPTQQDLMHLMAVSVLLGFSVLQALLGLSHVIQGHTTMQVVRSHVRIVQEVFIAVVTVQLLWSALQAFIVHEIHAMLLITLVM